MIYAVRRLKQKRALSPLMSAARFICYQCWQSGVYNTHVYCSI